MTVGILKRAGIPTPKRVVRRICHDGSCSSRLIDERIDFRFASHKVSQRELRSAPWPKRNLGLMGHVLAGPHGQLLTVHKIKKCDGPVFVLRPDDASGG